VTFEEQQEHPDGMKWRKGGKKCARKGGKREHQTGGFTVALFRALFHTLFFPFLPKLHVGPHFFRFSTLFALLIEKGTKIGQKTKRMAKRAKKGVKNGVKKGAKKGNCEQPYCRGTAVPIPIVD